MRGDLHVLDRIKSHSPSDLALSTITLAEICYRIEKSPNKKKERKEKIEQIRAALHIYSFDENAARHYASIRNQLQKNGTSISERDTQIASIARANKQVVVTHNTKEFMRVSRLKVEDWAR